MPDTPSGFALRTCLLTSWGVCRVHDLYTCTRRRERVEADNAARLAALAATHEQQTNAASAAHSEILSKLSGIDTDALQASFTAVMGVLAVQQQAAYAQAEAVAQADLDAVLPACNGEGSSAPLRGVDIEPEASPDFVDVVIHVVGEDKVKLRCTPDTLFVCVDDSEVAAADLVGSSIKRMIVVGNDWVPDVWQVSEVESIVLDSAASVYAVTLHGALHAYVGDASAVALVRCRTI